VEKDIDFTAEWSPYTILHIDNDGSFGTPEIRQAYRRLSKKYHPDKVDMSKLEGQYDKVERRWHNLKQAHETLTQLEKYNNWKTHGHPDGSMAVKAVELLLPSFLNDETMRPMVLTCFFLGLVGMILAVMAW